jgi:lipid-binding SYLF domain-containing protein
MNRLLRLISIVLIALLLSASHAYASSAAKIYRNSNKALNRLYEVAPDTRAVLARAQGILVFPAVYKAGLGIGGETGKGVLFRGGKASYYRMASGSVGFQAGVQKRVQIIAFMTPAAMQKFLNAKTKGFKIGVDGSVVIADIGASGKVDSSSFNQPIIGFVLGEKGLMYNATLEGTRIWKFVP